LKKTFGVVWIYMVWTDRQGQDLIEYALLAGFAAVAAGAIIPGVANDISEILSRFQSMMPWAASRGSVR
jgi:pilus assembly protein Flp/PilA